MGCGSILGDLFYLADHGQLRPADLARLEDLQVQLEAKRAELEAVQARNELVERINHEKEK